MTQHTADRIAVGAVRLRHMVMCRFHTGNNSQGGTNFYENSIYV